MYDYLQFNGYRKLKQRMFWEKVGENVSLAILTLCVSYFAYGFFTHFVEFIRNFRYN